MELSEIQARIEKKEAAIEKLKKKIEKNTGNRTKSELDYIKGLSWRDFSLQFENEPDFENLDAARSALRDLDNQMVTLNKYKNQLKAINDKANTAKIPVIVDFLENWIQNAISFYEQNVADYQDFLRLNSERVDRINSRMRYWGTPEYEAEGKKIKELEIQCKILREKVYPLTMLCYDKNSKRLDLVELRKELEKEADKKYWNLVNQITAKAGEIVDASNLHIGGKGDLNGYIQGTEHLVKVETIGAAGYNVIRFHWRTLIKVVN